MRTWTKGSAVQLETVRFELTSMTRLQALRATYAWTKDAAVMHPLGYPSGTWSYRTWYRNFKHFNNRTKFFLAIRPKGMAHVIGFESFEVTSKGMAMLTVAVGDRAWWGKGVVGETRPAVIDFLFDEVGCYRVWGMPAVRNFPSIFNYQTLGFVREGILRQHGFDHATGTLQDHVVFGMLRDEWIQRRRSNGVTMDTSA